MIGLNELLRDWLPEQRWFGGRNRQIKELTSSRLAVLQPDSPRVEIHVATVDFADEHGPSRESFQVPLSFYQHADRSLMHALVGELENPQTGEAEWVHDALRDRSATAIWLELLRSNATVDDLTFSVEPDAYLPEEQVYGDILTVEQSNSSLVYGNFAILKLFRKLEPGINPDIEVHRALSPAHSSHIAALLGDVSAQWTEPPHANYGPQLHTSSLAMLQTYLPSSSDGWSLASASVRDLYRESDLHPDEVGGDFAAESHRLGQATAEVHAHLARLMPTESVGEVRIAEIAEGMQHRLRAACSVIPELQQHSAAIAAAYSELLQRDGELLFQRVHGDLHLGQVMRTFSGWTLFDFEGEPARPMSSRRELDSPLRDVAGMLRSFDYAAQYLLIDGLTEPQLGYRAIEWADRNRDAFCEGYAKTAGIDPREDVVVLRAFELDKAVYEAMYEARHRPRWLTIPLRSLARHTAESHK